MGSTSKTTSLHTGTYPLARLGAHIRTRPYHLWTRNNSCTEHLNINMCTEINQPFPGQEPGACRDRALHVDQPPALPRTFTWQVTRVLWMKTEDTLAGHGDAAGMLPYWDAMQPQNRQCRGLPCFLRSM